MKDKSQDTEFARVLIAWQREFGRRDLPWMVPDPYRRWLSEVMLQQTQVSVVKDYFERFLSVFPTLPDLACASQDEVMRLWAGLGYYSRARNLHACARQIVSEFGGEFPKSVEDLARLPGIGRSTAGAIASFAFGVQAPILDGNVKRVFSRVLCLSEPAETSAALKRLWAFAEEQVPRDSPGVYNQALMDLGAMVCTKSAPQCVRCPISRHCRAFRTDTVLQYPVRRKSKAIPQVERQMLLCISTGKVLLERRDQKGVWQGLWSLPETDRLPAGAAPAGAFTHRFTHYTLQAKVFAVGADAIGQAAAGPIRWIDRAALQQEAIPTPVRRFLLALRYAD